MLIKLFTVFILLINSSLIYSQSSQNFYVIDKFITVNNDTIYNCKIGYRTFGNLNYESSNAIIYCSWFRGTSEAIGNLIEKRNFVDTSEYFIIAFDALGNGVSSSPSNHESGNFPEITIRDMVNAQYIVLTEHLKLDHLYGAIGGSMGSMQVLEWSVAYPEYITKIAAYVCTPKLTSYDLFWMHTQLQMIETLQKLNADEFEIKRLLDMTASWISRSPDHLNQNVLPEEIHKYLLTFEPDTTIYFSTGNYAAQLKAMISHDISKKFSGSMEEAAKYIMAELLLIVSEGDLTINPIEAIKLAEMTGSKLIVLENNCGHLAVSCEFERIKEKIYKFFRN